MCNRLLSSGLSRTRSSAEPTICEYEEFSSPKQACYFDKTNSLILANRVDMKKAEWKRIVDNDYELLSGNIDAFENFIALLGRGHLPRELPPPFSTRSFANAVIAEPEEFKDLVSQHLYQQKTAQVCRYSLARPGQLRRMLGITNPAFHFLLSLKLARLYKDYNAQFLSSAKRSVSFPTRQDDEKRGAFEPVMEWRDIPVSRLKERTQGRYLVQADISRFYPSIYTHSIPWAMHGKEEAKKNKNNYHLDGNFLDLLIRGAQDGQTLGVPIGPDTSYIVAEKLLLEIDKYIEHKIANKNITFFHRVDDYEFVCVDRRDADYVVALLQEALQVYELELNTLKTMISELPQYVQEPEVAHLRSFQFGHASSRTKLLEYYDLAFDCYKKHPTGTLKYAIKRIPSHHFDNTVGDFMLQSMLLEPGVTEAVLKWLVQADRMEEINQESFVECLARIVCEHSVLGHSSEVAWAIWGFLLLEERIPSRAASSIVKMNDAVVLLLALDAEEKGLLRHGNLRKKVAAFMSKEQLYGPHWLLAYEAAIKNWASKNRRGHVDEDPIFSELKKREVVFYELGDIDSYKETMKAWEPYTMYVPDFDDEETSEDMFEAEDDVIPF